MPLPDMNPMYRAVQCPVCGAPPTRPCNVPTDTGRRDVGWVHFKREDRFNDMVSALGRTDEPED